MLMFNEIIKTITLGGHELTLKTGKIARQADGAVMASLGDSIVLAAVVAAKEAKENQDFFPLTVNYLERAYAAGKIPGGYFKRETKPSDREVLVSRLIDRPIRPLFPESFKNETQVICTVLSYDEKVATDILALIAASAALAISGLPYMDVIAASKVGFDGENFMLNPSAAMLADSKLDLVVAGTKESILMVESQASELSEEQMLAAIAFGQEAFAPVIDMIKELASEANKPQMEFAAAKDFSALEAEIDAAFGAKIADAYWIPGKGDRKKALSLIKVEILAKYADSETYVAANVVKALEALEYRIVREKTVAGKVRIDGRDNAAIRPIWTEIGLLPRVHGSALFMRGETQALAVTTLGSGSDEQMSDSLEGDYKERFMLNYNFPQYCVGESGQLKPPGRREIGHGKLAWRALSAVLPTKEQFPYAIRVVSEITACNGSSSMATICGASMSMMNAGVPLSAPVAGIAMGLIKLETEYMILSDIIGDEDHLGDMDFKVAGTEKGITALQMDIKIGGIDAGIMKSALTQAKEGRLHILSEMSKTISGTNASLSEYAPLIKTLKIAKDKIRELIGPGGKMIKEICEVSKAKIDISDDGTVSIAGTAVAVEKAESMIAGIAFEPESGTIMEGIVVKIIESGAFIKIGAGRDGFVHISEIANERIADISSHLAEGQAVKVKVLGLDRGKIKLSIKQLTSPSTAADKAPEPNVALENKEEERKAFAPQQKVVKRKPQYSEDSREKTPKGEKELEAVVERKYFS
jgi:polyribonucleotide nucleotidyltransferase